MDLKIRVSLYKITESLQNSFLEQGLNIPKNVIINSINLELIKELNDFVGKYNMEGLQLQKEIVELNNRLTLLYELTEYPIQKGAGEIDTIKNGINETITLANKLKWNIDNLKFIE